MTNLLVTEDFDADLETTLEVGKGLLCVMFSYNVTVDYFRAANVSALPEDSYPEEKDFQWELDYPFYWSRDGLYWHESECPRIAELIFDQCGDEVETNYRNS